MANYIVADSPHIHSDSSERRIMLDLIIALIPAAIAGIIIFGLKALIIIVTCIASAVVAEYLFNAVTKRQQTIGDLTAIVTGLLLALNLSTNVELWQCLVGSAFAIIVVKCLFGGLGHNLINPAIGGRVFMIIAFSSVAGGTLPTGLKAGLDVVSGATPLEVLGKGSSELPSIIDMLIGARGGAIGETCIIALVAGFIYLLVRKVIRWETPIIFIATVFIFSLIKGGAEFALYEILSGGLFLGAIFMATDYVTTPVTRSGRMIFALGCGIITCIIRFFCSLPEGVSFSILTMNILTPFIEMLTAKTPLGGAKK